MGDNQQKLTGATFILVRPDGEMLLQLRDGKTGYYPNAWCFPGETREGNEEVAKTVERGIREEYGMNVSKNVCKFIAINHLPQISQEIGVFVCNVGYDQVPTMREGKKMRWMNIDEIEKLELGFEQNKFLPLVMEKLKESMRSRQ